MAISAAISGSPSADTIYVPAAISGLNSTDQEIVTLAQGTASVSNYFSRLRELWDEFETLMPPPSCAYHESKQYSEHFQFQKLWQFLMGLNDSYAHVKSQVLMIVPVPNVNQAYAMIINVESQRLNSAQISSTSLDIHLETALMSNQMSNVHNTGNGSYHSGSSVPNTGGGYSTGSSNGSNGGFRQRSSGDGRNSYGVGTSHLFCDFCHFKGHTREQCYKLHGYPKRKGGGSSSHANNVAAGGNHANDAGAYDPPVSSTSTSTGTQAGSQGISLFTPEQYTQILQMLSKGKEVDTMANVATTSTSGTVTALLSNVVNFNWIVDTGASNHMDLFNRRVLGIGKENQGLYLLQTTLKYEEPVRASTCAINTSNTSFTSSISTACNKCPLASLWHMRLGHASLKVLRKIDCLPSLQELNHLCTVCPLAKQARLPFPTSSSFSTSPFSIIHCDVWGPYRVPNHDAVYLLNRLPTVSLKDQSPFEKLFGQPPPLHHLKVFGSLCYATDHKQMDKFALRAIPAVHLGYSLTQKGYILYDLGSKTFFVSRDTVFQEQVFPFKDLQTSPDPFFPVLTLPTDSSIDPHLSSEPSLSPPSAPLIPPAPPRRSSRLSKPPVWLADYSTPSAKVACLYPISKYLSYSNLSPSYKASLATYSAIVEPRTYQDACLETQWVEAMKAEITALEDNQTWSVVPLPADKAPIGCKWVFKVKYRASGEVERYKARLVAKGYNQSTGWLRLH
ncbi:hypothetical protein KY290_024677 [Solanum tuberosum]|uniref:Uncharacterized protein n=1 Tax=Solanum tuberosum TaxID=4113 RepID=A0ABQ7URD4_SOLTU|nr:hypothetical protein KY290_024677 [Solanum tuberosum]